MRCTGTGAANDGGHDEDLVCETCSVDDGNTVTAWQMVLEGDGYSGWYGQCDVDSYFGPNTTQATRDWQSVETPNVVDGTVGSLSWGRAGQKLEFDSDHNGFHWYKYRGSDHTHYYAEDLQAGGFAGPWFLWWDGARGWDWYETVHYKNNAHSNC